MIGQNVTGADGKPLTGVSLTESAYQPATEVKELFSRCQLDYQTAWRLQHRPFDEFDGISLLERAKLDQETFGAFVGAEYIPQHKKWRWRGRKNTARNKLIGILAHLLAGMLYPLVHASNEENEEDKMTARVMRILIENHLKQAGYEIKFLYMVLSALVNPAVVVEVDYVEAMQRIKQQLSNGNVKITEAVDDFLSGLALSVIPIDQFLIADFFTPDIQTQPYIVRVQRISYDKAKKIWGKHKDWQYVRAGQTRVLLAGQEHQTLYDVEWTEADRDYVQIVTFQYRDEDLEATFVGGVFVGEENDIYNRNPFQHRRLSLVGNEWMSIPIYQYAKSGFEPIDPTGRFFYYKSGAFKEYWDDKTQNEMHRLLVDGTKLDVFKPAFLTGLTKVDGQVMAPGATIGMPAGASVEMYSLSPNLSAAMAALQKQETDMSESTQDKIMEGKPTPGITATQSIQAQNQARIFLGVFGTMIADLIRQIGELTMDCIIQNVTVGEVDATLPEALKMRYRTILAKGKDKGKEITNRIVFTDAFIGRQMHEADKDKYEWKLWKDAGGENSDQSIYHVNPYKFARMKYSFYIDPEDITSAAMGNSRLRKLAAFQMFTNPIVAPFVDMKNVVDDFVIEEFSEGDPDRYKIKGDVTDMMSAIMGGKPSPLSSALPNQGAMVGAPQKELMSQTI